MMWEMNSCKDMPIYTRIHGTLSKVNCVSYSSKFHGALKFRIWAPFFYKHGYWMDTLKWKFFTVGNHVLSKKSTSQNSKQLSIYLSIYQSIIMCVSSWGEELLHMRILLSCLSNKMSQNRTTHTSLLKVGLTPYLVSLTQTSLAQHNWDRINQRACFEHGQINHVFVCKKCLFVSLRWGKWVLGCTR